MATKRKRPVVTAGQAKQAEDVLRYLYNKGERLMDEELYYQGAQIHNGAGVLGSVLRAEGIDCKCDISRTGQRPRIWNCSCSLAGKR